MYKTEQTVEQLIDSIVNEETQLAGDNSGKDEITLFWVSENGEKQSEIGDFYSVTDARKAADAKMKDMLDRAVTNKEKRYIQGGKMQLRTKQGKVITEIDYYTYA